MQLIGEYISFTRNLLLKMSDGEPPTSAHERLPIDRSGNLQTVQLCGFVPALGAPPQRLLAKPTPTAPPLRHLANLASEVVRYAVISNRDGPARNAAVRTKCGNEATCFSLHCIATRESASAQLKRGCNAAVRVVHCYCFLPQFSKHGRCAVAEIVPRAGGWRAGA